MIIGKNTFGSFVKTMCQKAGIEGPKTNYSLCATGVTNLFTAGVQEKIIQKQQDTGHCLYYGTMREYQQSNTKQ